MISRRTLVNLIVFMVIAVGLIGVGVVNLLGNPLQHPTKVSAVFPDASGLHSNFTVTYNGVDVGSVTSVKLAKGGGAQVNINIDPGQRVPNNVLATVDLANALGEQEINLVPQGGTNAPPLRDGQQVKVDPNGVPASIGELVTVASRVLNAIPAQALNNVLHETAVALKGRGQDLRTITDASIAFDEEFLHYQNQFKALLANSPPVMNAVSAVGPQLQQALANTAVLTQVLAQRRYDLANAINQGTPVANDLQALLSTSLPNLACLTHDFADFNTQLNQPSDLAALDYGLVHNNDFYGAIDAVGPLGVAKPLYPGDPGSSSQPWLRVRLLLPPPAQPQAVPYSSPNQLPPTRPGAGCSTELGQGVGPATQANPSPPGPGGSVQPPTAAEAQVRGGGPTLSQPADYATQAGRGAKVPGVSIFTMLVAGLAVVGGGMAAGRARTRRPVR